MATEDYVFTGYHDDDAKLLNKIIEENWEDDPLKPKKLQYYDESKDISSVNFNTGEVAIKIYADDAITSPMGIGFDSIEQDRYINIEVRTIDRDLYLGTLDELRRIFIKYRFRPGNAWDTMWLESYAPVYPTEKFYHGKLVLHLKQYCHSLPRPRDGWHSDTYY